MDGDIAKEDVRIWGLMTDDDEEDDDDDDGEEDAAGRERILFDIACYQDEK